MVVFHLMNRLVVTTIKTGADHMDIIRATGISHLPHRGSRRRRPADEHRQPPAHLGASHWSARLMAERLGISFASVARIWRKWKLQPWRRETFKFSTDPQLEAKLCDVGGRYLNPR